MNNFSFPVIKIVLKKYAKLPFVAANQEKTELGMLGMLQTVHAAWDIRGTISGDLVAGRYSSWELEPAQSHGKPPGMPPPISE